MPYLQLCFLGEEWQLFFFTTCTLGNNNIILITGALFQLSTMYYVICGAYIDVACTFRVELGSKHWSGQNRNKIRQGFLTNN